MTSGRLAYIFFTLALVQGFAHNYGPAPRVTGAPGDNDKACTQCHVGTALNGGPGGVRIVLQSGPIYIPGIKQRVTVEVSDSGQQRWGFELTARLNSDLSNTQAGQLIPVDNFTQVICEDASIQPCTSGVSFIQHTSAGTRIGTKGPTLFQFDWLPPATNAGPVSFFVAGNAANGDGTSTGDHIYTSSAQLNPATPVAPIVTANNIVSAATSLPGPVAANSWMSVYGSNLGVTTRSWQDADFLNGGFPVSLDGVSVVLTANGAPRRAFIGYVSPTQINFLVPSDVNPNTVQVQVKNPAGITAQFPITVQAPAPQLLTLDGKYVSAAHADGSIAAKAGLFSATVTAPAVPGETIVLYATGCGPTSPALISSQVPTQPNSLVTLPQISIGGAAATVVSANVLPGTGGVYQIKVQVPATAANRDLPVVAQLGTTNSASTLITVQR